MIRLIAKLSFPIMLSQGILTLMLLTDRYFLGKVDLRYASVALSGGHTANSFCMYFISFIGLTTALIGKKFGEKNYSQCNFYLIKSLFFCLIFLPIIYFLTFLGKNYFVILKHSEFLSNLENEYFKVMMLSNCIYLFKVAIESYFIGIGRTKIVLFSNLIGVLINFPLTYLFLFGSFNYIFSGATGAAWATTLSTFFSLLTISFFLQNDSIWKKFKFNCDKKKLYHLMREMFVICSSSGLEKFINTFCFVLFMNMFFSYGNEVATAVSLVFSWDQIVFLSLNGIYSAELGLFSRYLGENDNNQAVRSLHAGVFFSFMIVAIFSMAFFFAGHSLIHLFFSKNNQAVDWNIMYNYSIVMLKNSAIYIFAYALIFTYKAALRSLGLNNWCLKFSSVAHIILVLGGTLLVYQYQSDAILVWKFYTSLLFLMAISLIIKFYRTIPLKREHFQLLLYP